MTFLAACAEHRYTLFLLGASEVKASILDELLLEFAPSQDEFKNELLVGSPDIDVSRFYVAWNTLQLDGILKRSGSEGGVYVAYLGLINEHLRCLLSLSMKPLENVVVRVVGDTWRYHSWGVAAKLARDLGLAETVPVRVLGHETNYKLVTFVPSRDVPKVRESLFASGAGRYGEYSKCSFRALGKGTFLGSKASKPAYGKPGRFEEIEEERLEVIVPFERLTRAVAALRKAHPYEEPVVEAYEVESDKQYGEGRIGFVPSRDIREASRRMASVLGSQPIYLNGQPSGNCVMIWDGNPVEGLYEASLRNVDLYIGSDSGGLARLVSGAFDFAVIEFPAYCFTFTGARELIYLVRERSKHEAWGLRTFLPSKVGREGVS